MYRTLYEGEGMMGSTGAGTGTFGSWGFIIFFLFILWLFFGMNKEDYCNQDARADRIAETAKIEYNNLLGQRNAKEAIMSQASLIRNEQQAETIFDLKIENNTLKQNNVLLEKFNAIEQSIAECCCGLNRRLDSVECSIPQRPPFYAQGFVTTGQPIPNNGFCYNA